MDNIYFAFFLALLSTIIAAFGALLIKIGSDLSFDFNKLKKAGPAKIVKILFNLFIENYKLFLGLFLYVVSTVPFLLSLKYADLSLMYPVVSLSYVWVMLLSYKILGEKINNYKALSILFILLGVVFIGLSVKQ